jgi:copper chaperone CopZ
MTEAATTRSYSVEGMTCDHCRLSVIEEISEIDGVASVEVDLETGRADIEGSFTDEQIRDAVAEAGYRLVEGR